MRFYAYYAIADCSIQSCALWLISISSWMSPKTRTILTVINPERLKKEPLGQQRPLLTDTAQSARPPVWRTKRRRDDNHGVHSAPSACLRERQQQQNLLASVAALFSYFSQCLSSGFSVDGNGAHIPKPPSPKRNIKQVLPQHKSHRRHNELIGHRLPSRFMPRQYNKRFAREIFVVQ